MAIRKTVIHKDQESALGHYVYDLSLPMGERREKRLYFPTGLAAASFLGVAPQRIYANRKTKSRVWSEALNGWFAIRLVTPQTQLL